MPWRWGSLVTAIVLLRVSLPFIQFKRCGVLFFLRLRVAGALAMLAPVLSLDGKDEVRRAGVDLEALFSECLAERVGVRRGTVV